MNESPSLSTLSAALGARKLPPVDQWNPAYCGEIDMRIAADGSWHYLGTPIGRPALVQLFASVLRREPDGQIVLVTPVEKVGIRVDDAPFLAVELLRRGDGEQADFGFRTLTEDVVWVDADHPLRVAIDPASQAPRPYVHVRGGLDALVNRAVFYEMVYLAETICNEGAPLGLRSAGQFWRLDGQ
jgi:uncharacterized protein